VKAPDQYEEQHHVHHDEGAEQDAGEPPEIGEPQLRQRDRNISAEHQGHGLEPAHFRKGFRRRRINEREQQHDHQLDPRDEDLRVCLLFTDCQPQPLRELGDVTRKVQHAQNLDPPGLSLPSFSGRPAARTAPTSMLTAGDRRLIRPAWRCVSTGRLPGATPTSARRRRIRCRS
jgi:hypothetical protein